MMNLNLKTILVVFGVIILIVITGIAVNSYNESSLIKKTIEATQAEDRFKNAVITVKQYSLQKDTLTNEKKALEAIIEYQRNNTTVIIQQNDKTHLTIDKLNAINTAIAWTNDVADYDNNRDRYSLHRFSKKP